MLMSKGVGGNARERGLELLNRHRLAIIRMAAGSSPSLLDLLFSYSRSSSCFLVARFYLLQLPVSLVQPFIVNFTQQVPAYRYHIRYARVRC